MQNSLIFILVMLSLCPFAQVEAQSKGPAGKEGGGGFEFYYTDVDRVLRESQNLAVEIIQGWSQDVWQSGYFLKPVDREKLIHYIRDAQFNKDKEVFRKDPSGVKDSIMMNYDTEGDFIEVLLPTFREVKERLKRYENLSDIWLDTARAFVHESLHLFGYSESEAYNASRIVYGFQAIVDCDKLTSRYPEYQCVFPTPDRVQHAQGLLEQWMKNKSAQPYVVLFGDPESVIFQVDLMTKFNTKSNVDLKMSERKAPWETITCKGNLYPMVECQTERHFILDLSKTAFFSFNDQECSFDRACSRAVQSDSIPLYFQTKLKTAKSGTILIRRK